MGKRIAFWLQDIVTDFENIDKSLNNLKFRGVKGTVGSQASFFELFQNDYQKAIYLLFYLI